MRPQTCCASLRLVIVGRKEPYYLSENGGIERIQKIDINFGVSRFKEFKFDVSKRTSVKGLIPRVSKRTGRKDFTMDTWIHGKPIYY